jgi:hypothetical protein
MFPLHISCNSFLNSSSNKQTKREKTKTHKISFDFISLPLWVQKLIFSLNKIFPLMNFDFPIFFIYIHFVSFFANLRFILFSLAFPDSHFKMKKGRFFLWFRFDNFFLSVQCFTLIHCVLELWFAFHYQNVYFHVFCFFMTYSSKLVECIFDMLR